MGVYVDPLWRCIRSRRWPHAEACHLVADTREELHAFAERLGLRPEWFQRDSRLPHYDLTRGKRFQALRLGAQEISHKELAARVQAERHRLQAGRMAQAAAKEGNP